MILAYRKEKLGKGKGYDGEVEDLAEKTDFPGLDAEDMVEARALPAHGGQIIFKGDQQVVPKKFTLVYT